MTDLEKQKADLAKRSHNLAQQEQQLGDERARLARATDDERRRGMLEVEAQQKKLTDDQELLRQQQQRTTDLLRRLKDKERASEQQQLDNLFAKAEAALEAPLPPLRATQGQQPRRRQGIPIERLMDLEPTQSKSPVSDGFQYDDPTTWALRSPLDVTTHMLALRARLGIDLHVRDTAITQPLQALESFLRGGLAMPGWQNVADMRRHSQQLVVNVTEAAIVKFHRVDYARAQAWATQEMLDRGYEDARGVMESALAFASEQKNQRRRRKGDDRKDDKEPSSGNGKGGQAVKSGKRK